MSTETPAPQFPPTLELEWIPERLLGEGTSGTVFLARRRSDGVLAAIKLLKTGIHASAAARFRREIELLRRVNHPGVVRLLAEGKVDGCPYLATEFLGGSSLETPPPNLDLIRVALEVAGGLEALHLEGLVHRDVKPANIVLAADGRAVLIDLGLVFDPDVTALTATGSLVGTPAYLSPELLRIGTVTPAADFYALGVTLFVLAEDRAPFEWHHLSAIAGGVIPPLRFHKIPEGSPVATAIQGLVQAEAEDRIGSKRALQACLGSREPPPTDAGTAPLAIPSRVLPVAQSSSPQEYGGVPSRTRPVLLGGALLLIMALATWLSYPAPRSLPGPVPQSPLPSASPLPPGSLAFPTNLGVNLRSELDGLATLVVNQKGVVRDAADSAGIPPGFRGVLTPDPYAWFWSRPYLPSLKLWQEWLEAGGAPHQLDPDTLEDLRRTDRWFLAQDLAPPFSPFLDLPPSLPPKNLPEIRRRWKATQLRLRPPTEVPSWSGAALQEAVALEVELEILTHEMNASRKTRQAQGRFPPSMVQSLATVNFTREALSLAEFFAADRVRRATLSPWLAPAVLRFRRVLAALGFALRDPSEPREAIAQFADFFIRDRSRLFRCSVAAFEPEDLLGAAPQTPASWLIHAILRAQINNSRLKAVGEGGNPEDSYSAFRAALAADPETAPEKLENWRRSHAYADWYRLAADLAGHEAGARMLKENRRGIDQLPPFSRATIHYTILRHYRDQPDFPPDDLWQWTQRFHKEQARALNNAVGTRTWRPTYQRLSAHFASP